MRFHSTRAIAQVRGGEKYPNLRGTVLFQQLRDGVLVTAQIQGLPMQEGSNGWGVFGFHIHTGDRCTGTPEDEFAGTLGHFNPQDHMHPYHAGDLPPLFSNNGSAYLQVLTGRFSLREVIGKTVVIHDRPDDFKTQPSGDSGTKIACGRIVPMR